VGVKELLELPGWLVEDLLTWKRLGRRFEKQLEKKRKEESSGA
jgi:hypothetical protein